LLPACAPQATGPAAKHLPAPALGKRTSFWEILASSLHLLKPAFTTCCSTWCRASAVTPAQGSCWSEDPKEKHQAFKYRSGGSYRTLRSSSSAATWFFSAGSLPRTAWHKDICFSN